MPSRSQHPPGVCVVQLASLTRFVWCSSCTPWPGTGWREVFTQIHAALRGPASLHGAVVSVCKSDDSALLVEALEKCGVPVAAPAADAGAGDAAPSYRALLVSSSPALRASIWSHVSASQSTGSSAPAAAASVLSTAQLASGLQLSAVTAADGSSTLSAASDTLDVLTHTASSDSAGSSTCGGSAPVCATLCDPEAAAGLAAAGRSAFGWTRYYSALTSSVMGHSVLHFDTVSSTQTVLGPHPEFMNAVPDDAGLVIVAAR